MTEAEERMIELERSLNSKLDETLKATNQIGTQVELISQALESKDETFRKFEVKTEQDIERIFTRVSILEKDYASGEVDREIIKDSRKIFVKWVVSSMIGLVAAFGAGTVLLMNQISKIPGVG